MKNNINFFIIILIIFFAQLLNANDLFESPFKKIEFQTNNIEDTKNYHINELKIFNLNQILKNILTNENYKKLRNRVDSQFADSFIKNIIIENEKILNDRYSANIKINFDKNLIIKLLRNNKLPYVEYLPDNFLTIILDERAIQQNLFNKDNKYYDYLLKNEQEYLSFYMIPNLDINDRFLINAKNVINKDLNSISKIFNKYNNSNLILIYSHFESNLYNIEIHLINNNSFIFLENLKTNNLDYETFFTNLKFKVLENWKANNFIQNTKVNKIECLVNSLNIYELQKINSLIKSISIISDYKLMKIKLYKNLYEISYFGNYDIFNKLLSMKSININLIKDKCEINLI